MADSSVKLFLSVLENPLIRLHSTVLNDLRDREKLMGRCGHCRYKYVCGGCQARAYAYHEDHLMPDSGCIRELEEHSVSPVQAITVIARKV